MRFTLFLAVAALQAFGIKQASLHQYSALSQLGLGEEDGDPVEEFDVHDEIEKEFADGGDLAQTDTISHRKKSKHDKKKDESPVKMTVNGGSQGQNQNGNQQQQNSNNNSSSNGNSNSNSNGNNSSNSGNSNNNSSNNGNNSSSNGNSNNKDIGEVVEAAVQAALKARPQGTEIKVAAPQPVAPLPALPKPAGADQSGPINTGLKDMMGEQRLALEQLHKRAVKDLEDEEKMRLEFEKRKTKQLKELLQEEEDRVMAWRDKLRSDMKNRDIELKEWREKKLPDQPVPEPLAIQHSVEVKTEETKKAPAPVVPQVPQAPLPTPPTPATPAAPATPATPATPKTP